VPVTVLQTSPSSALQKRQSSDIHPSYKGTVLFRNVFDGRLAATDYPKVNVRGFCVRLPYRLTPLEVLSRHAYLLLSISSRLGLDVSQACYRDPTHTSKVFSAIPVFVYSPDSVQYYLSCLVGFLIIEMVANLGRSSCAVLGHDNEPFFKLIIDT
jgi:hypothetical protein